MRANGSRQKGLTAQNWALFFYVTALFAVICGSSFAVSCGTTSVNSETETASESPRISNEPPIGPDSNPETAIDQPNSQPEAKAQNAGTLEAELEIVRAQNSRLEMENVGLRTEAIRLNEALADANQTIYSLNKKLDAIFKPEAGVD